MIWSNNVAVFGIGANGGKGSFVDDSFDLNDHRVEDVDVERIAVADHLQMFLKKADDTLVTPSDVWAVGGNEIPLQALHPHL